MDTDALLGSTLGEAGERRAERTDLEAADLRLVVECTGEEYRRNGGRRRRRHICDAPHRTRSDKVGDKERREREEEEEEEGRTKEPQNKGSLASFASLSLFSTPSGRRGEDKELSVHEERTSLQCNLLFRRTMERRGSRG